MFIGINSQIDDRYNLGYHYVLVCSQLIMPILVAPSARVVGYN